MSETLVNNGMTIPYAGGDGNWPPRDRLLTSAVVLPPWQNDRSLIPNPIKINVGRQLFVDNGFLEDLDLTVGVTKTYYAATPDAGNPLIDRDLPGGYGITYGDGVWYDPDEGIYKAFYGNAFDGPGQVSLATATAPGGPWTKQGVVWTGSRGVRHGNTVWLDLTDSDPAKRWKMFVMEADLPGPFDWHMGLYYSADGRTWSARVAETGGFGTSVETTSVTHNPFRSKWVLCQRSISSVYGRFQRYLEADTAEGLIAAWVTQVNAIWLVSDVLDPPLVPSDLDQPQIYRQSVFPYESIVVSWTSILEATQNFRNPNGVLVELSTSRDGFYFDRTGRTRVMDYNLGSLTAWNGGDVNAANGAIVKGDTMYVYGRSDGIVSGFVHPATSLWTLRRDGFCSVDAGGTEATLVTRPVQWDSTREHLFLNLDARQGYVDVEVLDAAGTTVLPMRYVRATGNSTTYRAHRKTSAGHLSASTGTPVRFRFKLKNAKLYAFWTSPTTDGASNGQTPLPG